MYSKKAGAISQEIPVTFSVNLQIGRGHKWKNSLQYRKSLRDSIKVYKVPWGAVKLSTKRLDPKLILR